MWQSYHIIYFHHLIRSRTNISSVNQQTGITYYCYVFHLSLFTQQPTDRNTCWRKLQLMLLLCKQKPEQMKQWPVTGKLFYFAPFKRFGVSFFNSTQAKNGLDFMSFIHRQNILLLHNILSMFKLQRKHKEPRHTLTVELVDLRQVGENAGQLIRVQHRPHLLKKDLVQDPKGAQVGRLCGEQLWQWQGEGRNINISALTWDIFHIFHIVFLILYSYHIWRLGGPPPLEWVWREAVGELCPASSGRHTPHPPAQLSRAAVPTVNQHSWKVTYTNRWREY